MRDALTISAFAKRSGVPSKTIRYWEGLGLLPKAARSHTGYRVFDPSALRYVAFVQKSKAIGLTLAEMQEVLHLARAGRCPCPEVFDWTQAKAKSVAEQIRELSALLKRLKRIEREWKRCSCEGDNCGQVCSLIAGLPECKSAGGKSNGKNQPGCCSDNKCCSRERRVLSGLPAVPASVLPASRRVAKRRATNQL
ncbi:MAG TPA: MerR family transcriptional regulator [Candidatus Acidoferrales bacterium]|nr:MerR family transcriptional regulator [Candidatus Acidoferrales bacterium]